MGSMTIRNIPDEIIRRLDERAATTGRSREAEACAILSASLAPASDWEAFREASAALRAQLGMRTFGNSAEDLTEARAERTQGDSSRP